MTFEDYLTEIVIRLGGGSTGKGADMVTAFKRKYHANPLNDREMIVGEALVELVARGDKVELKSIRSAETGKGHASAALKVVTDMADDAGVELQLFAKAFGTKTLSDRQLATWYKKNGFKSDGKGGMVRPSKEK